MEYELKHYYRVKYALVCARQSFLKNPPKDDYERYARKVIDRAYFLVLNKIDELDGTNGRLLKYYKENIEKYRNVWYNVIEKGGEMHDNDISTFCYVNIHDSHISGLW